MFDILEKADIFTTVMSYYDDNFGVWDNMEDPEMVKFYHQVQRESKETVCVICGRTVMLRRGYDKCNSCCDRMERGWEY